MFFTGKWMELEIIMKSKVNQAQKDKGHIFPHMWKIVLQDNCIHKHIYDLLYICSYRSIEREKYKTKIENIVKVGLFEGSIGMWERKRE
jgi:hypothetical protein